MKIDIIEIYTSRKNGEHSWRYIAKNGKRIACAGETYLKPQHAVAMATQLFAERIASGVAELRDNTRRRHPIVPIA